MSAAKCPGARERCRELVVGEGPLARVERELPVSDRRVAVAGCDKGGRGAAAELARSCVQVAGVVATQVVPLSVFPFVVRASAATVTAPAASDTLRPTATTDNSWR